MEFSELPIEIVSTIFTFLDAESLLKVESANPFFKEIVEFCKIWEKIVKREEKNSRLWKQALEKKYASWRNAASFRILALNILGKWMKF